MQFTGIVKFTGIDAKFTGWYFSWSFRDCHFYS
jgi:hypothetical protein